MASLLRPRGANHEICSMAARKGVGMKHLVAVRVEGKTAIFSFNRSEDADDFMSNMIKTFPECEFIKTIQPKENHANN
jgi:hypothetical protein